MNQPSPGSQEGGNAFGTAPKAQTGNRAGNQQQYQTVLGPFTVRDLTVFASTAILFVASLLPMFGGRYNLWNLNNLFFLGLGIILPIVVTALFVARRLQPASVIRIGSLSIDQFASVVASFTLALFFLTTAGVFTASVLLGLLGALGLVAATVLAPHLPYLSTDFKDRAEIPAHLVARNAAVPTRKPAAPKPAPTTVAKAGTPAPAGETWPAPANYGPAAASAASAAGAAVPSATVPSTTAPPTTASPAAHGAEAFPATQAAAVVPPARAPEAAEGEGPATHAAVAQAAESSAEEESVVNAPDAAAHAETPEAAAVPAAAAPAEAPHVDIPATAGVDAYSGSPTQAADAMPPTMASPAVAAPASARRASFDATVDPASRPEEAENGPAYEAFWFAVPQPRTAVDEHTGAPVFTIEPGGWVLALEDRGDEFLVQHTDGRVGILRDLSHIERG